LTIVQGDFRAFNKKTPMERQRIGVDFDVTTFWVRYKYASSTSVRGKPLFVKSRSSHKILLPHLSVAIWSFAIEDKSSWLVAAERLVNGVFTELPFLELEAPAVLEASVPPTFAACFAAFSARRFCLEAEGIVARCRKRPKIDLYTSPASF
jgi:hypothetical protein